MGTIDQELNDYVWDNIELLEAIFSEKIYKILLRFKNKEDRESFIDTLEAVVEVDDELFYKLEIIFKNKINKKLKTFQLFNLKGFIYYKNEEFDKAVKEFEKAIESNPYDDTSYNNCGFAYMQIKAYDNAIEAYNKAIELNPNNINSYFSIGTAYHYKKEYHNAMDLYKKAIELNPNFYLAFENLNKVMNNLNQAFFLNKTLLDLNFYINKIKIQNFKQYQDFSIDFSKQINIIIGQNAIGKTTLLQAITLGLLKEDSLDTKQLEYDTFVKKGQNESEIIIYHNDEEKKIEIKNFKREIEENFFIPFLLAYGSNFFTSKTNEVKEVAQSIVNHTIHRDFTTSIFMDYTNGFVNPIRLLEFLDLEKDESVPKIQKTFIEIINSFLEGFELKAVDKNYYFQKEGSTEKLKLEELSEGYRGNVLLITDMLIKILGVGEKPESIEGIVLIDEFDKHLHPKWQSQLVNQLTKTFPKIQFIMTTHNPMSILDRNSDEITILKEINGEIVAVRGGGTKTIDVSTVLLEYFGVKSTVSESMQESINRFNQLKLLKEISEEEKKELKELEIVLGNTVASNLIYDRKYLHFLEYIREHTDIDFDKYEKLNDEEMDELLKDFGDFFND